MILLIDNYDSFTFNLSRYLQQLGLEVDVVRNDASELTQDLASRYRAIVISPGPKRPDDAGFCLAIVRRWSGILPMLGVCLGHQVICQSFGAKIVRAQRPMHGKKTEMKLRRSPLFEGIPSGLAFGRYHSLVADPNGFPEWLEVIAESPEGEIMATQHREHLTYGVQFHPESVLSTAGHQLLRNFANLAGLPVASEAILSDLLHPKQVDPPGRREDLHLPPEEIHAYHQRYVGDAES